MQKIVKYVVPLSVVALVLIVLYFSNGRNTAEEGGIFSVGVFVPGIVDGSPTYEMMVAGVEKAVEESEGASMTVIEGGFDQSTWEQSVMSMAAGSDYDVIVTSNPSMPDICEVVSNAYPDKKFIVLDGYLASNDSIFTVLFNQREQSFLAGYFAGLVTGSNMEKANPSHRIGLLAGQEYPIMNDVILPGYEEGINTLFSDATIDFRVLGNWYDAGKAAEIVTDMIRSGSDVILTIAGGGNQGTISAAREQGAYVVWYDNSGYDLAPGIVVGSTFVRQDDAAYNATLQAIDGTLPYGTPLILGVAEGAVAFDMDHPAFTQNVPSSVQEDLEEVVARIRGGDLVLEMPVP